MTDPPLSPHDVVCAYAAGAFPMADARGGRLRWYSPDPRALLPLDERFHVRRSLRKRVRQTPFRLTVDRAFAEVIHACAQPRRGDADTWISPEIERVYTELHRVGLAHSIEAWTPEGATLVGGVYGVSLGGGFFAESMFSRRPYASQLCLVELVERLRRRGFVLLDVQFRNAHLEQFGVIELPRDEYLARLRAAIEMDVVW